MSRPTIMVRRGEAQDLAAVVSLYNRYISHTATTFDTEAYSVENRQGWFSHFDPEGPYQLWVAVLGSEVVGYACTSSFRAKAAYQPTVESSIYIHPDHMRQGIGTLLYSVLLKSIEGLGVHRVIAGITLPNPGSEALHLRFGFQHVGTMSEVGFKLNRYWDVAWYEREMQ